MVLRAAIRWQTGISEGGVCSCCVIQHLLASLSPLKIPAGSGPPSDTILADGTHSCRTKTPSTKHTYHWFHPTQRRLSYFQSTGKTTLTTGWGNFIYLWHSDRVFMLKGFLQTRDYVEEEKACRRLGKKSCFASKISWKKLVCWLVEVASNSGPLLGSCPRGVTPPPSLMGLMYKGMIWDQICERCPYICISIQWTYRWSHTNETPIQDALFSSPKGFIKQVRIVILMASHWMGPSCMCWYIWPLAGPEQPLFSHE